MCGEKAHQYYQEHKEKFNQKAREYYQLHKEEICQYRQINAA
jgi:hypothetical protein